MSSITFSLVLKHGVKTPRGWHGTVAVYCRNKRLYYVYSLRAFSWLIKKI